LSDLEAFTGALMIGTVVFVVVASVFMVGLRLWLRRQPVTTQARVQERMTRFSEQSLKFLDGTASAYAVFVVVSLVVGLLGAVLLLALTMLR
jgi:hypothetical protein